MSPKNGHPLGPGMSSNERTPSGSSALPEFNRLRVVPHFSSGIVERALKSPHARKGDKRRERKKSFFSLPVACRLFSRGVIFTRVRVSHALLSLRKNGGLLVVYEFNRQPNRFSSFPKGLKSQIRAAMTKPEQNKYSESSISQKEKRTTVRVRTWHKKFKRPYDLTKYLCC